jgi:hypothetical protein
MPKCGQFYKRAKIGDVFGRLTVLSFAPKQSCLCRCVCGTTKTVAKHALEFSKVKSCGCFKDENTALRNRRHGLATREKQHPLYGLWSSMMNRCNNPGNKDYGLYGGRGIRVSDLWHDFPNFLADMGERPSKRHSLDRYPDKDGNYEPGNIRWATDTQQTRNRRNTILIDGEPLQDVADRLNISPNTLKARIRYGMTGSQLLFPGRYKSGPKPKP